MTIVSDLERDLAEKLSAADTGTIGAIELVGNPFTNFSLADNVPWTVLSPMSVEHLRAGRPERCPDNAQVLLTMQVRKKVNGNGDALLALLSRYNVSGYVFGHVHQVFDRCVDGVRLLASPSTCFQFAAGSSEFGIDPAQPGYRWLELGTDGTLSTSIGRLTNFDLKLDLTDTQY